MKIHRKERACTRVRHGNLMANYRSSGRELRKSPKGMIAGLIAAGLLIGGAYGVRRVLTGMHTLIPTDGERSADHEVVIPGTTQTDDPDSIRYDFRDIFRSDIGRGELVLVNRDHPVKDVEYGLVNVYETKNEFYATKDMEIRLQKAAADALNDMTTDFYEATGHSDLMVMNGYRSYAEQQQLYENDLQRTGKNSSDIYAVPGCSELESGFAFTLSIYRGGNARDFNGEDDYAWIVEHCAEYGFILRYPPEKEDVTKVKNQPFVFRYVGAAHALNMQRQDLCMEEYVQFLAEYPFEGDLHCILRGNDGIRYECYYVSGGEDETAEMVSVPVPSELHYAISGNNCGGFFVTAELPASDESSTAVITLAKPSVTATETTTTVRPE